MKHAYLTIDDGPSKDFLSKVSYLRDRQIPAIFFCIGENIEKRFQDVVTAIKVGYPVGNHSYSHRYFSDLTTDEAAQEIRKTDQLIDQLYLEAGVDRPGKYFRFPHFDLGGHSSGAEYEAKWNLPPDQWNVYPMEAKKIWIQRYLCQLNYEQPKFFGINTKYFADKSLLDEFDVRCTFDQAEYHLGNCNAPWGLSEEEAILARIDEDFPFEGRSLRCADTSDIVLIHDHEHTTELFFKIIDSYLDRQISFQTAK